MRPRGSQSGGGLRSPSRAAAARAGSHGSPAPPPGPRLGHLCGLESTVHCAVGSTAPGSPAGSSGGRNDIHFRYSLPGDHERSSLCAPIRPRPRVPAGGRQEAERPRAASAEGCSAPAGPAPAAARPQRPALHPGSPEGGGHSETIRTSRREPGLPSPRARRRLLGPPCPELPPQTFQHGRAHSSEGVVEGGRKGLPHVAPFGGLYRDWPDMQAFLQVSKCLRSEGELVEGKKDGRWTDTGTDR